MASTCQGAEADLRQDGARRPRAGPGCHEREGPNGETARARRSCLQRDAGRIIRVDIMRIPGRGRDKARRVSSLQRGALPGQERSSRLSPFPARRGVGTPRDGPPGRPAPVGARRGLWPAGGGRQAGAPHRPGQPGRPPRSRNTPTRRRLDGFQGFPRGRIWRRGLARVKSDCSRMASRGRKSFTDGMLRHFLSRRNPVGIGPAGRFAWRSLVRGVAAQLWR